MESQTLLQLLRAKRCLDRLFARVTPYDNGPVRPVIYSNNQSPFKASECTPYACTFTFPSDNKQINNVTMTTVVSPKGITRTEVLTLKPFEDQLLVAIDLIKTWLKKLYNTLKRVSPNNCYISDHIITFEKTKSGVVHAHGLIYVNNNYYTAVSQHMGLIWCKLSGGLLAALAKKNKAGKIDNAFDKCSDVYAWFEYITKDQNQIMTTIVNKEHWYNVRDFKEALRVFKTKQSLRKIDRSLEIGDQKKL